MGGAPNSAGGVRGPRDAGTSDARGNAGALPDGGESSDAGTPPAIFTPLCTARSGPVTRISGVRKTRFSGTVMPNAVLDATGARWDGTTQDGTPIPWVVTVNGEGPACWYGGSYTGIWDDTDPAVTWENPYHHSGAFTIRVPDFLVEGYRADNQGDGIRMEAGGSNFHIRAVYMSNIHDDCVENDSLHGGVLEDSLFDGCYTGFSADDFTKTQDGSANTWIIRKNLMYLKPTNTVFRGPSPGTGLFFKGWVQAPGPAVVLKDNIFRIDSDSGFGSLALRKEINLTCENNVIVWTGSGPFPYDFPDCFTITSDVAVWNQAVSRWKATHPEIR